MKRVPDAESAIANLRVTCDFEKQLAQGSAKT